MYGEVAVSGTDEVLANWEAIKAEERAQGRSAAKAKKSPLSGVPKGLPALAQAESYLDRMSRLRSSTPPRPTDAPHPPDAPTWAALANLGPDEALTPEVLGQALFEMVAWALARGVESESSAAGGERTVRGEVAEREQ